MYIVWAENFLQLTNCVVNWKWFLPFSNDHISKIFTFTCTNHLHSSVTLTKHSQRWMSNFLYGFIKWPIIRHWYTFEITWEQFQWYIFWSVGKIFFAHGLAGLMELMKTVRFIPRLSEKTSPYVFESSFTCLYGHPLIKCKFPIIGKGNGPGGYFRSSVKCQMYWIKIIIIGPATKAVIISNTIFTNCCSPVKKIHILVDKFTLKIKNGQSFLTKLLNFKQKKFWRTLHLLRKNLVNKFFNNCIFPEGKNKRYSCHSLILFSNQGWI